MATTYVHGAVYRNKTTDKKAVLLGLKINSAVIQDSDTPKGYQEIPHDLFQEEWEDAGQHDHIQFCCDVHNTHATPHTGCIFR